MKNPYFGRVLTAMVTPFAADGSVNLEAAKQLVEWWIAHGTDALVVTGSTGEAATMTLEEKKALWTTVIKQVNGRIPLQAPVPITLQTAWRPQRLPTSLAWTGS